LNRCRIENIRRPTAGRILNPDAEATNIEQTLNPSVNGKDGERLNAAIPSTLVPIGSSSTKNPTKSRWKMKSNMETYTNCRFSS